MEGLFLTAPFSVYSRENAAVKNCRISAKLPASDAHQSADKMRDVLYRSGDKGEKAG